MVLCLACDATGVRVLGDCVGYGTARELWLFLSWLRRRKLVAVLAVAAAAEVRGRGGRDTRLDAVTAAGCRRAAYRRAALVVGCRRGGRGRGVGEGGCRSASVRSKERVRR